MGASQSLNIQALRALKQIAGVSRLTAPVTLVAANKRLNYIANTAEAIIRAAETEAHVGEAEEK